MKSNYDVKTTIDDGSMNTKDFMIGALIGGMVGAATALFLAPKSGRELREDLNTRAGTVKERAANITEMAKEKGSEMANVAKEKTSSLSQTVKDQSDVLVEKVRSIKQTAQDAATTDEEKKAVEELGNMEEEMVKNTADSVTQKLEETQKAFDDTENTLKKNDSSSSSQSNQTSNY